MQSITCSLLLIFTLDEGSSTMAKVKKAAKGVVFELANDRALVMEGPEEKVDHLVSFLQQLVNFFEQNEHLYHLLKCIYLCRLSKKGIQKATTSLSKLWDRLRNPNLTISSNTSATLARLCQCHGCISRWHTQ